MTNLLIKIKTQEQLNIFQQLAQILEIEVEEIEENKKTYNTSITKNLAGIFANKNASHISDKEAKSDYLNEKYG